MPSEAIQVLENTSSRVVVWDPPYYSFGIYLFFLSAALIVPGLYLLVKHSVAPVAWILLLTGMSIACFASFLATSQRIITLSRSDGTLTIKKSRWGMVQYQAMPIAQVSRIEVKNVRYSQYLIVLTKTGEAFSLGNGSDRQGYYAAADAMNRLIGVGPR